MKVRAGESPAHILPEIRDLFGLTGKEGRGSSMTKVTGVCPF